MHFTVPAISSSPSLYKAIDTDDSSNNYRHSKNLLIILYNIEHRTPVFIRCQRHTPNETLKPIILLEYGFLKRETKRNTYYS